MDRRIFLAAATAGLSSAVVSACGGGGSSGSVASDNGNQSNPSDLLNALQSSGLTNLKAAVERVLAFDPTLLQLPANFTVFGPTNSYLTAETVASTSETALAAILRSHIVPSVLRQGTTYVAGQYDSLQNGAKINLSLGSPDTVVLNGSNKTPINVLTTPTPVEFSAGILYAIAGVLQK